jgi:hypothetical protein
MLLWSDFMSVVWISHNPSAICVHICISKALDVLFVWLRVLQCAKQKIHLLFAVSVAVLFGYRGLKLLQSVQNNCYNCWRYIDRVRSFGLEVTCIVHSYGFQWEENFVGSLRVKLKPWMLMEKICIEWWPFAIEMYIEFSNQVVSNSSPVSEYLCSCVTSRLFCMVSAFAVTPMENYIVHLTHIMSQGLLP